MTDIDDLLRDHAARWVVRQPSPPPLEPPQPQRPSRVLAVAATVVIVAALALGAADLAQRSSTSADAHVSPSVRAHLIEIARRVVGPGTPISSAQAARPEPPRMGGVPLSAAGKPPPKEWVLQIRGDFVCYECKLAPKAKVPRGTVYRIVVDATTWDIRGFQLTDKAIDLSRFGRVVTLIP